MVNVYHIFSIQWHVGVCVGGWLAEYWCNYSDLLKRKTKEILRKRSKTPDMYISACIHPWNSTYQSQKARQFPIRTQRASQSSQYDLCESCVQKLVLNPHFPVIKCRRGCKHFQGRRFWIDTPWPPWHRTVSELWYLHLPLCRMPKGRNDVTECCSGIRVKVE